MTGSRDPADGWVQCACGARHWGRNGAAGLLLTDGAHVVLQHRVEWSHFGGTWALPGGARHEGEGAVAGALREAAEEAGIDPDAVTPIATSVLRHPDWSYTTLLARTEPGLHVAPTDAESLEIAWVDIDAVPDRPLLPAFAQAWPRLRSMLEADPHVVVDVANVMGSRPDGWWRDRLGAARRLLTQLDALARTGVPADLLGLAGDHWWPRWHAVTEGAARTATGGTAVDVVAAPGSGDETIVAQAAALAGTSSPVLVVTADRELRRRVAEAGARPIGPSSLLPLLHPAEQALPHA